jgi:Flp pilus assembly pilin Flp
VNIKLVLVAACALIDSDGRVLLTERPAGKSMAGLWEFPGGKIEVGERPEQTLCVPALGGDRDPAGEPAARLGEAKQTSGLPDAAGGRTADLASDDTAELGANGMTESRTFIQCLTRLGADHSGATAIEYAVIASGVSVLIVATVFAVGGGVKNFFTTLTGMFP